jgi:hypothetical protein
MADVDLYVEQLVALYARKPQAHLGQASNSRQLWWIPSASVLSS